MHTSRKKTGHWRGASVAGTLDGGRFLVYLHQRDLAAQKNTPIQGLYTPRASSYAQKQSICLSYMHTAAAGLAVLSDRTLFIVAMAMALADAVHT